MRVLRHSSATPHYMHACVGLTRDVFRRDLHGRKIRVGWAQKNTSLFIANLHDAVTTEQLKTIFRPFGELDEVLPAEFATH